MSEFKVLNHFKYGASKRLYGPGQTIELDEAQAKLFPAGLVKPSEAEAPKTAPKTRAKTTK